MTINKDVPQEIMVKDIPYRVPFCRNIAGVIYMRPEPMLAFEVYENWDPKNILMLVFCPTSGEIKLTLWRGADKIVPRPCDMNIDFEI
jgi:hypothetical protein